MSRAAAHQWATLEEGVTSSSARQKSARECAAVGPQGRRYRFPNVDDDGDRRRRGVRSECDDYGRLPEKFPSAHTRTINAAIHNTPRFIIHSLVPIVRVEYSSTLTQSKGETTEGLLSNGTSTSNPIDRQYRSPIYHSEIEKENGVG
uniref:Uncharacterized protein n=1 Tax=Plectus sambesii TaxID=2011161 RepID=A0A914UUK5_9BILA